MLIYGAYGYTGSLIVESALEQGLRPLLAGRDAGKLKPLAERYGLPFRAFDLHDAAALDQAFKEQRLILNCAGPFTQTYRPVAAACLRQGVHYLDITGEIEVFEALAALNREAKQAGVMLLPGVGFDVVPTDCVAAHLKDRLPSATQLALAFRAGGGFSRGTRRTMLESLGRDGAVRRDGHIVRVPAAWKVRQVDFGEDQLRTVVSIPWGDIATAWYSTGIPNIETYAALKPAQIRALRLSHHVGWLLRSKLVRTQLRRRIDASAAGPDAVTRRGTESVVWGEASDLTGQFVHSRLRCANGYSFTARSAVAAARRVLAGDIKPGFQTPSRAFGIGFALALGARITDLP
ncbi:MAG TPA: saccharopine dehydrogenase NADP-binding domain-containing protein [Gammaproteobacteria bacterium]|nr:saccharopine dehydrogenase NADP-binding domain-containing protein [Gammaproteobacteria bacterium]